MVLSRTKTVAIGGRLHANRRQDLLQVSHGKASAHSISTSPSQHCEELAEQEHAPEWAGELLRFWVRS